MNAHCTKSTFRVGLVCQAEPQLSTTAAAASSESSSRAGAAPGRWAPRALACCERIAFVSARPETKRPDLTRALAALPSGSRPGATRATAGVKGVALRREAPLPGLHAGLPSLVCNARRVGLRLGPRRPCAHKVAAARRGGAAGGGGGVDGMPPSLKRTHRDLSSALCKTTR